MTLTADQQSVADAILKKLFEGKEQEIIISGPAGTGKTFLVQYLLSDILAKYIRTSKICSSHPKFVEMGPFVTATTNKACGVLREAFSNQEVMTIESALGLVVTGDYTKGEYKLTPSKRGLNSITDSIIIIDEASMIDRQLYKFIRTCCIGCFIVYVGDDCQLPAVKEGNTPLIWQLGLPEYKLTTLVRQSENPVLEKLCQTMRETVQTKNFKNIYTNKSVYHLVEPKEQEDLLKTYDNTHAKILTYTNAKAIQYNEYLLQHKYGYKLPYYAGEDYVVNEFFLNRDFRLQAESLIRITNISPETTISYHGADCLFHRVEAATPSGMHSFYVPVDKLFYHKWLKFIAKEKDWKSYFYYKENVVDLRANYACTIHKAQGSTFDAVIIDADDFKSCTNPSIAARLLYVAVSRARKGIVFFGNLPKKYGEIKCHTPTKAFRQMSTST